MNDTYVECLVAKETKGIIKFLRYLLIILATLFILGSLVIGAPIVLIIGIAFGVGAYFMSIYSDVEFEYLYVDHQISVDKIFSKQKRKKVATYDVGKMEILAPVFSYKLDDFKNRTVKEIDYTSGVEKQPDVRYAFYYEGQQKVLIEPSEAFVKAIQNVAPRKVFTN